MFWYRQLIRATFTAHSVMDIHAIFSTESVALWNCLAFAMFTASVTHWRSRLSSNAITWWFYAKKWLCLKTLNLFAVVSRSLARKKNTHTNNNCNYLLCAIFIFHEFIAWCVRLLSCCFLVFIFQFLLRRSWCCVARGIHFNSLRKCCCFIFHVQLISQCTILRKKPLELCLSKTKKKKESGSDEVVVVWVCVCLYELSQKVCRERRDDDKMFV